MKVYTKTGDNGTTSLVGGTRVSKASERLEAYGTVDELNAAIGLLLTMDGLDADDTDAMRRVQNRLFDLGAQLATEPESAYQPRHVADSDVAWLEQQIDRVEALLPRQFRFVLPGGCMAAAQAHVARTVARRAERCMVRMDAAGASVEAPAMRYINRLSDYLYVLSRKINIFSGVDEIFWDKDC